VLEHRRLRAGDDLADLLADALGADTMYRSASGKPSSEKKMSDRSGS